MPPSLATYRSPLQRPRLPQAPRSTVVSGSFPVMNCVHFLTSSFFFFCSSGTIPLKPLGLCTHHAASSQFLYPTTLFHHGLHWIRRGFPLFRRGARALPWPHHLLERKQSTQIRHVGFHQRKATLFGRQRGTHGPSKLQEHGLLLHPIVGPQI